MSVSEVSTSFSVYNCDNTQQRKNKRDNNVPKQMARLSCSRIQDSQQSPTAVQMESFITVQRLGMRSASTTKDKTNKKTNKSSCLSIFVRGATGVDVLEWYAVMGGIFAARVDTDEEYQDQCWKCG